MIYLTNINYKRVLPHLTLDIPQIFINEIFGNYQLTDFSHINCAYLSRK